MGVSSALYSGVSGLNANANAMSVLGDNLANANTVGFKSSRTIFGDLLSARFLALAERLRLAEVSVYRLWILSSAREPSKILKPILIWRLRELAFLSSAIHQRAMRLITTLEPERFGLMLRAFWSTLKDTTLWGMSWMSMAIQLAI